MSGVSSPQPQGVAIRMNAEGAQAFCPQWRRFLADQGLLPDTRLVEQAVSADGKFWIVRLSPDAFERLCPSFDTLGLDIRMTQQLGCLPEDRLMLEAWLALLAAPVRMDFDSLDELASHLRVRCHTARAAEKTALAFKISFAAERPEAFWHDEEKVGFLLKPQADLIDALVAATQPERTGRLYDFSCNRASEYVMLLGLAQEAQRVAPQMYERLQATFRQQCIKSDHFNAVFLNEYGSLESPVPPLYYVPGDRVWFKNPDPQSSDACGYEGSWVIYMGRGLFSNFWKRDRPFTLEYKALEIYHWRHSFYLDSNQEMQIDEQQVEWRVRATQGDAQECERVLARMMRYRDPYRVFAEGGCIDATREFARPFSRIMLDGT